MDWIIRFWNHQRDMKLKEEENFEMYTEKRRCVVCENEFEVAKHLTGVRMCRDCYLSEEMAFNGV